MIVEHVVSRHSQRRILEEWSQRIEDSLYLRRLSVYEKDVPSSIEGHQKIAFFSTSNEERNQEEAARIAVLVWKEDHPNED